MTEDHEVTTGHLVVGAPQFGGDHICSVRMTNGDGFFSAIDLMPEDARLIGISLLERAGAVNSKDVTHEVQLGARH
jgi:hypothetical protein